MSHLSQIHPECNFPLSGVPVSTFPNFSSLLLWNMPLKYSHLQKNFPIHPLNYLFPLLESQLLHADGNFSTTLKYLCRSVSSIKLSWEQTPCLLASGVPLSSSTWNRVVSEDLCKWREEGNGRRKEGYQGKARKCWSFPQRTGGKVEIIFTTKSWHNKLPQTW